jgi:hypothetical protein
MNRFSFVMTVLVLTIVLYQPLQGFFLGKSRSMTCRRATIVMDLELAAELSKPNRWGYQYSFPFFPHLCPTGLTYSLSGEVSVRNVKPQSVEEAEKIFLEIYTDYLQKLNSVRIIRPYLHDFPLTPWATTFVVKFQNEKGEKLESPYISVVHLNLERNLEFSELVSGKSKIIIEKPLKEIPQLVTLCSVAVEPGKVGSIPAFPEINDIGTLTPSARYFFDFSKNLCSKNHLEYVVDGVCESHKDSRPFEFVLRSTQTPNLSQARKLAASCAKETLSYVQNNKEMIEYVKERKTWERELFPRDFPERCHITFRISFWDEYVNRVAKPCIAEIRVAGESFKYYTADEGQRLVLAYEETWDDAMKFLEQVSKAKGE